MINNVNIYKLIEFAEILKGISLDMNQNEFQRQVGKMEVLGELLIREK